MAAHVGTGELVRQLVGYLCTNLCTTLGLLDEFMNLCINLYYFGSVLKWCENHQNATNIDDHQMMVAASYFK